jgi:hypothetical protein
MKLFSTLFFFLIGLQVFGQGFIGFPFANRSKVGPCPICNPTDSADIRFLAAVDKNFKTKYDPSITERENCISEIYYLDSLLQDSTLNNLIKARLINMKIFIFCNCIVDDGRQVYNYSQTLNENNGNFSGALYILSLYDEILSLELDSTTIQYFRNVKLAYCAQSGMIQEINNAHTDWIEIGKVPSNFKKNEKLIAENFLETQKLTNYNPFLVYNAWSPGLISSYGKELWYGFQLSFEPNVEVINPFRIKHRALGYRTDFRVAALTSKLLLKPDLSQKEILFSIFHLQNVSNFSLNILQFGWHLHQQEKNYMFYRPEIGIHYGIFTLTYGYNLTFNKQYRPTTEKHLVNFTISYPLFRVGEYY